MILRELPTALSMWLAASDLPRCDSSYVSDDQEGDMRKCIWLVAVATLTLALSVGVATANAGGGNSANAKLCQKGGWMNLQGSDGTQFTSEEQCVSFGAQGGTIVQKPPCTAGSENFSEDADGSTPATFAGGTIPSYGGNRFAPPGIAIQGTDWAGFFPDGAHVLYTGSDATPFRVSFTNPVSSVQLDAETDDFATFTLTLNAYDASDALVGTDSESTNQVATLSVTSTSNNIQYFTIDTSITDGSGLGFTNIVWDCA